MSGLVKSHMKIIPKESASVEKMPSRTLCIERGRAWLSRRAALAVHTSKVSLPKDTDVVARQAWCVNSVMREVLRDEAELPLTCMIVDPVILHVLEHRVIEEAVQKAWLED
jgi:hypothetical protein